jgi:hypothetical protein
MSARALQIESGHPSLLALGSMSVRAFVNQIRLNTPMTKGPDTFLNYWKKMYPALFLKTSGSMIQVLINLHC